MRYMHVSLQEMKWHDAAQGRLRSSHATPTRCQNILSTKQRWRLGQDTALHQPDRGPGEADAGLLKCSRNQVCMTWGLIFR